MADGTWTEIVSASTESGGGATAHVTVVGLGVQGYDDIYDDAYEAVSPDFASGGSTATVTVSAAGGTTPVTPPAVTEIPGVTYSLVVVARIPRATDPPTLTELGQLTGWSGLFWEEALNTEAQASVTVDPHNQPGAIASRLADLADGSELWVYRESEVVFAGPIIGYQVQAADAGLVATVQARSLWHYPRRWWVEIFDTLTYNGVDQYQIVRNLVDYYQALTYGHYGLTVSSGLSGVTRDRTYNGGENHNIGQRIEELAAVNDGFDFAVDPATREIQLGLVGASGVVLDRRNVSDPSAFFSVGPDDLASEAYAFGDAISSHRTNTDIRTRWGRSGAFQTFDGVTQAATLNSHGEYMLDVRDEMGYEPGPNLIPVAGADIDDFGVGDTVEMVYDYGFSTLVTSRQVTRRRVSVTDTGDEAFSVEFDRGHTPIMRVLSDMKRRISELEART